MPTTPQGVELQPIGGAITEEGQRAIDMRTIKAPDLGSVITGSRLGHGLQPLSDHSGVSSRRANKPALVIDLGKVKSKLYLNNPSKSYKESHRTTTHAEESTTNKSLSVTVGFSGIGGSGEGSANITRTSRDTESCSTWYSVAHSKFPSLELGNFVVSDSSPCTCNPELVICAKALADYLRQEKDSLQRGEKAVEGRALVKGFFDDWGNFIPSSVVMGQMATFASKVEIDSTTTERAAKKKAEAVAAAALVAMRTSAEGSTQTTATTDNRSDYLEVAIISGAAPATVDTRALYQMGSQRHDHNAWRCIEILAGTPVLDLVEKDDRDAINEAIRSSWFPEPPTPLQDGSTYEIVPRHAQDLLLHVKFGGSSNGRRLHLWGRNTWWGMDNQRFKAHKTGDEHYILEPCCAPGMAINYVNGNMDCILREYHKWGIMDDPDHSCHLKPEPTTRGWFTVTTRSGGHRWAVEGKKWNDLVTRPTMGRTTFHDEFKFVLVEGL